VAGVARVEIKPSPSARQLFNQMVARSGKNLHLSAEATVALAAERTGQGHRDVEEIRELEEAEWIDPCKDGGWLLH